MGLDALGGVFFGLGRALQYGRQHICFVRAGNEEEDVGSVVNNRGGEGDALGGTAVIMSGDGDDGLRAFGCGDGAGEEGGSVAVAAHPQEDQIKAGPGLAGGELVELGGVVGYGRVRSQFPLHAVDIFRGKGHVIQQDGFGLAVIAAGVSRGNQPLISPKDVGLFPGQGRHLTENLVESSRCAAAGENDGETAVCRHCFLGNLAK